jgi:hypothetical protein
MVVIKTGNIQTGIIHITALRLISVIGTGVFPADSSRSEAHAYNILVVETSAVQIFKSELNSYGD